MIQISNDRLCVRVGTAGQDVVVEDRQRRSSYRLLPGWRILRRRDKPVPCRVQGSDLAPPQPLPPGQARQVGPDIEIVHDLPEGSVTFRWSLAADHVRVRLRVDADGLETVALPGAFAAEPGPTELLLPIYQGVLFRGTRDHWTESHGSGGHGNFSMGFAAVLAARGALLVTQESLTDWVGTRGQSPDGPTFLYEQRPDPAGGWSEHEVRLYPCDRDVTAVAKCYRRRVIERGEFVGWDAKIAAKPALERLFGSLIAFTGYNHTDEIDYAACARRLREMGFQRVLYYPVRMCCWSLDYQMGGDRPVWLSDAQLAAVHAVPGAMVAPWAWIIEALDDGSAEVARQLRRDAAGDPITHWQIDDQVWKVVCTAYQTEQMAARYTGDMAAMDWVHYDVNAMNSGMACFAPDHPHHAGRAMTRREDVDWTGRLLSAEVNGNRVVSSEGFNDRYTGSYDIGSTKLLPAWGDAAFIPVPLTGLVFHDSVVHDWWEVHNYNANPGFGLQTHRIGTLGAGAPRKKAAMDALYGCPPNVFAFGRQYGWEDIRTRKSFSFLLRLDDPPVQEALAAALPVARLHGIVGQAEMVSWRPLSDDFAVQETVFSDGSRIVANLSDSPHEVDGLGTLEADSWRRIAS